MAAKPRVIFNVVKVGVYYVALAFDEEGYLVANTIPLTSYDEAKLMIFSSLMKKCSLRRGSLPAQGREIARVILRLFQGEDDFWEEHKFLWLKPRQVKVIKSLRLIKKGKVVSYAGIAKAFSLSSRVVGQVLRANPFPLLYPCHRVVRSDGRLGGYLGSNKYMTLKSEVLSREGVKALKGVIPRGYFQDEEFVRLVRAKLMMQ